MIARIATSLLCTTAPFALLAQEVNLRSPDEFISVDGEIVGFNGTMLRVQTLVGQVSVPASEVICYGEGCLEIVANNDFGLTADAFEGIVAVSVDAATEAASATQGGSDELTVSFASPLMVALYTSLVGALNGTDRIGAAVALDSSGTLSITDAGGQSAVVSVTADPSDVDILLGTVSLEGSGDAVFDAPAGWVAGGNGLTHQMLGLASFSVQVAPSAGVEALSLSDLAGIFAGEITNWSEVGGANMPVLALRLPDNSPIQRELQALVMNPFGKTFSNSILTMGDEGGISASVNQFPGSVSIVSTANANADLVVPVQGSCEIAVAPTPFNIVSGDYPLVRPIMARYNTSPQTGLVADLFDFAASDAGQGLATALGLTDFSAVAQDRDVKNARLSSLLNATLDDLQKLAAAQMFQLLFDADRLSTTLTGGVVSGPEAGWNRAMMLDLIQTLSAPENAGREVIFVGAADGAAGSQAAVAASASAAAEMRAAFEAAARDLIGQANLTVSSYGFGDVAQVACLDGQAAGEQGTRVEVWLK